MTPLDRNQAIAAHAPIVRRVASHLRTIIPAHWEFQDLLGYAWIAFLRALDAYDPARAPNPNLASYLSAKTHYLLLDLLREIDHPRRIGDRPIFVQIVRHPPQMPQAESSAALREIWDLARQLPPRYLHLLRLHYQHHKTLRECADVLGITASRASQIHNAAILKLRELASQ